MPFASREAKLAYNREYRRRIKEASPEEMLQRREAWQQRKADNPSMSPARLDIPNLPRVSPLERHVADNGACRGETDTFLPTDSNMARIGRAKSICETCPVKRECRELIDHLEAEIVTSPAYYGGVWAGESPGERARRRGWRKAGRRAA